MPRLIRIPVGLLVALAGGLAVYLAAGIWTPALLFCGSAALGAFLVLCRWAADFSWRAAAGVTGLLLIALGAPHALEALVRNEDRRQDPRILGAIARTAFPLRSTDAGSGFEDLVGLGPLLGGRRMVLMGEATHGTSEFFRLKHRLVEFLVTQHDFRDYAMEVSPADGQRLNAFLAGEAVDVRRVLYWPWATEEVLALLNWMRDYNAKAATAGQRIRFHGIDPGSGDRDAAMAANASAILEASPAVKLMVWAHNAHISGAAGAMGSHVKRRWGEAAYRIGLEFHHGSWTSRAIAIHTFETPAASPEFYAWSLAQLPGSPLWFLDLPTLLGDPVARDWVAAPRLSHHFQEMHLVFRLVHSWHTLAVPWPALYDGVLFVRESTPARGLGGRE